MGNAKISRIRLIIVAGALLLVLSAFPIVSVRADGTLLRGFDVPATVPSGHNFRPAIYWPIGIAFDGNHLWYSQPCQCTSGIFETTTTGQLLRTLTEVSNAGGLAWDGNYLWVGSFPTNSPTCTSGSTGCAFLTEVDVANGLPIRTVDLSSIFAQDQECGLISGLNYDSSTGTFWATPNPGCLSGIVPNVCNVGFVYNIDTSGNLVNRLQLSFGAFSTAKVGNYLYASTCQNAPPRSIYKTTLSGTVVSSFPTVSVSGQRESAEDVSFDSVTFAPSCALWVMQLYGFPFDASIAAYQIACP